MRARRIQPSAEQNAAINAPGNVVVRAGAGAGKTEVLAHRFVAHLAGDLGSKPLLPVQIAAITFTEKATFDMRERIADVLDERLERQPSGACRDHLMRAKRTLALARISTIHAFCAGVLRENPLAAGLDPGFEVIDQYETATFLEQVCEQILVDAVRARDKGALSFAARRRIHGLGHSEGAVAALVRMVGELRRLGYEPEWVIRKAEEFTRKINSEGDTPHQLALQLVILIDLLVGHRKAKVPDELTQNWPELRPRVLNLGSASEPAAFDVLRELLPYLPKAAGAIKDTVLEIRELVTKSGRRFGLDGAIIRAYGDRRAELPMRELAEFVATAATRVERAGREKRVVTFDDLLTLTYRMLRENPIVAARYRSSIRALLVDEYQDTDAIQHEIVMMLARPGADCSPQLFVVGDEKQSIYGFRGADITVFELASRTADDTLALRDNRRSTRTILDFINALSAHVMRVGDDSPQPFWVRWSDSHMLHPVREAGDDAAIELLVAAKGDNATQQRACEAAALAGRITQLIAERALIIDPHDNSRRPARYADIAILMRAFTDLDLYEYALGTAGIPYYTVKGRGFFGCKEILDIAALLAAIENPRDSLALAAALRSPLFAVSDQTLLEIALHLNENRASGNGATSLGGLFASESEDFAWLDESREPLSEAAKLTRELRAACARVPLASVLEYVLEATAYEAVLLGLENGRQRVANLRKLVEMARGFGARGCFTFRDFVIHLRNLTENPPYEAQAQILGENENVVRLMTIHQAKGLEFPVVIVPDLGRDAGNSGNLVPLLSPNDGLLASDTDGSGYDEIPMAALEDFRKHLGAREEAESVRILYVALTRARDRLIMSEGTGKRGWISQIRKFLESEGLDVKAFLKSGADFVETTVAGAPIILRKPAACELKPPHPPVAPICEQASADDNVRTADLARRRLNFVPKILPEVVISPTALADFARCPRQYMMRQLLHLNESSRDGDGDATNIAMGTIAHAVLERLESSPGSAFQAGIASMVDAFGAAASLTQAQCRELTRDLHDYVARHRATLDQEALVGRELPFFLNAGDGAVALFIRGQIDVLVRRDGKLIVRDYKYARQHGQAGAYQIQMECYALAAGQTYPDYPVTAEIAFLRDGKTMALELPSLDQIRANLLGLAYELVTARRDQSFRIKPAGPTACLRLGCGFVSRCWPSSLRD
ncbi:MAG: UvrD-helicase domain-containing protein [Candidatus Binataceae bacterium]